MIVNTYSVLAAFVAVAELALGAIACGLGWRAARRVAAEASAEGADPAPLLHLTASRLVVLGAASVPIVYLMLRSYVAEWPGVMCVQGVTRVGSVSVGIASWLPALLATLFAAKCVLLVVTGAWVTLHAVDRRTRTAPLARRVAAWIAIAGAVAVADGATAIAYLAIPKREVRLQVGCCTAIASETTDPARPRDIDDTATARRRASWTAAYFGLGATTAVLTVATLRRDLVYVVRPWWTPAAACGAVATSVAGAGFFGTALAPVRLRMPLHECGWCLVDRVPALWFGIAALVTSTACVLWAAIGAAAASGEELGHARTGVLRTLLWTAAVGYAAALVMAAVELWLS